MSASCFCEHSQSCRQNIFSSHLLDVDELSELLITHQFFQHFFCHYRNESIERRAAEPTALTSYALLGIFLLASAENEALYCDYVCLYQSDHVIQIFLPFVN
jgi:hypothetical protein